MNDLEVMHLLASFVIWLFLKNSKCDIVTCCCFPICKVRPSYLKFEKGHIIIMFIKFPLLN